MNISAEWHTKHPGRKAESNRKYRLKHADKLKAYRKTYWLANRERILATCRERYIAHPIVPLTEDERKRRTRARYQKDRGRLLAKASARYHSMTPKQRIEHNRKRRERHARQPEVRNIIERLRDHAIRAGGIITIELWQQTLEKFGGRCIYCGTIEHITIEHLLPVSRGGDNNPDNLAPACLSCNSSKRNKTYYEYMGWREKQYGNHQPL